MKESEENRRKGEQEKKREGGGREMRKRENKRQMTIKKIKLRRIKDFFIFFLNWHYYFRIIFHTFTFVRKNLNVIFLNYNEFLFIMNYNEFCYFIFTYILPKMIYYRNRRI